MTGWWSLTCWNGLSTNQQDRLLTIGNLPLGYRPEGTACTNGAEVAIETEHDQAPGSRFYCRPCAIAYLTAWYSEDSREKGNEMSRKATAREMASAIEDAKSEIIYDIRQGVVPVNVRTFGELHSYVDANEYGGLTDERDWFTVEDANNMQEAVHQWLQARPVFISDLFEGE